MVAVAGGGPRPTSNICDAAKLRLRRNPEPHEAATRIQTSWRGLLARKETQVMSSQVKSTRVKARGQLARRAMIVGVSEYWSSNDDVGWL